MKKSSRQKMVSQLVGRENEKELLLSCLMAKKNVLLEGPVGVGKTVLALDVAESLRRPMFRIDGDSRYTEQKLTGWFDPNLALKKGFNDKSFIKGPLVEAMETGAVLFINELNRLPEGVQNVLLPAIDERMVTVPRMGLVRAQQGFLVIATQNPKEFVATTHLSEAILDRFELVVLDYQSEVEEHKIVKHHCALATEVLIDWSVTLVRMTRKHPEIRRGASIRATISIAEIATVLISEGSEIIDAFSKSVHMALPTRIEIERSSQQDRDGQVDKLIDSLVSEVLSNQDEKKKL